MIPDHIRMQANSIQQNWGIDAAQRYLSNYQSYNSANESNFRGDRWLSNDQHQPRRYSDLATAMISIRAQAGESCRGLASRYGCSQGTISNVCRHRGAYRVKRIY